MYLFDIYKTALLWAAVLSNGHCYWIDLNLYLLLLYDLRSNTWLYSLKAFLLGLKWLDAVQWNVHLLGHPIAPPDRCGNIILKCFRWSLPLYHLSCDWSRVFVFLFWTLCRSSSQHKIKLIQMELLFVLRAYHAMIYMKENVKNME